MKTHCLLHSRNIGISHNESEVSQISMKYYERTKSTMKKFRKITNRANKTQNIKSYIREDQLN